MNLELESIEPIIVQWYFAPIFFLLNNTFPWSSCFYLLAILAFCVGPFCVHARPINSIIVIFSPYSWTFFNNGRTAGRKSCLFYWIALSPPLSLSLSIFFLFFFFIPFFPQWMTVHIVVYRRSTYSPFSVGCNARSVAHSVGTRKTAEQILYSRHVHTLVTWCVRKEFSDEEINAPDTYWGF